MRVDQDDKQRMKAVISFVLEFYKILMGTFSTAFIPRECENGVCSITDNIYDDEVFHRVAISLNAFSFLVFLAFYYSEITRENWAIEYLDIDPDKPNNNLDDEIEDYPLIKKRMHELNKKYLVTTQFCSGLQVVNIGVSLGDIASHWAGAATVTPLLSSILLIFMKLYASYVVARASIKDERVFSAYLSIPKTFNTIDEDHRQLPHAVDGEDPIENRVVEVIDSENVELEVNDNSDNKPTVEVQV